MERRWNRNQFDGYKKRICAERKSEQKMEFGKITSGYSCGGFDRQFNQLTNQPNIHKQLFVIERRKLVILLGLSPSSTYPIS